MTSPVGGTHSMNKGVMFIATSVLLFAMQTAVLCEDRGTTSTQQSGSSEVLSDRAARLVAGDLTTVLKLLQNGGPPIREAGEPREEWSIDRAIRSFYGQPVESYTTEQYLIDYRKSFLCSWREQLADSVHREENGEVLVGGGGGTSCCFQSAGTTRGHYDAAALVDRLVERVIHEKLESRRADGKQRGVFSVWSSVTDAPMASSEAITYLFTQFAEGAK